MAWQNKLLECAHILCAWKTGVLVEKLCCESDSEVGELVYGGAEMVEDGFVPADNAVQADNKAERREAAMREDAMRRGKGRRDAFMCLESEDDLYEMVEEGSVHLSSDDDCEEDHHIGRISGYRGTGTVDAIDSDMAGSLTSATVDSERNGDATGASQSRMAGASRLADQTKRLADEASSALASSTSPAGSAAGSFGPELDGVADLARDDDRAPHATGSGVQEVWGQDRQGTFEQEVALVRLRCEQDLLQVHAQPCVPTSFFRLPHLALAACACKMFALGLCRRTRSQACRSKGILSPHPHRVACFGDCTHQQEKQALASKLRLAYETLAPLRSEVTVAIVIR